MVGIDATKPRADIVLTHADNGLLRYSCPHLVDMIRKLCLRDGDVLVPERYIASFFHALVRFRSCTAEDGHGVHDETIIVVFQCMDKAIACSQQHDKHEDAPRHSKACKRGAQLVAPSRTPYFTDDISH